MRTSGPELRYAGRCRSKDNTPLGADCKKSTADVCKEIEEIERAERRERRVAGRSKPYNVPMLLAGGALLVAAVYYLCADKEGSEEQKDEENG